VPEAENCKLCVGHREPASPETLTPVAPVAKQSLSSQELSWLQMSHLLLAALPD
jgi:hypothetical protein